MQVEPSEWADVSLGVGCAVLRTGCGGTAAVAASRADVCFSIASCSLCYLLSTLRCLFSFIHVVEIGRLLTQRLWPVHSVGMVAIGRDQVLVPAWACVSVIVQQWLRGGSINEGFELGMVQKWS